MAETRSYSYNLNFGVSIEKPKESKDALKLTQNSEPLTIDKKNCNVALNGVKFFKRIYEPGLIEAEVAILSGDGSNQLPSLKAVKELFLMRFATLSVVTKGDDDEKEFARNYYVHQVNPKLEKNNSVTSIYVKLSIYSLDKLMCIDKYSKAYVAKKLGSEILENETLGFGFEDALIETDIKSQRNLLYLYKEKKLDLNKKTLPVNVPVEFIQPYLVQYNETFHDFMVRTANRCGEFFYFEDGKLILGLPETTEARSISDYENVTFQDSSDSPMDIIAFARDGVKDNERLEGFNADPIDTDKSGYPKDSFPGQLTYNSELFHDDLIFPMKKDNFTSFGAEMGLNLGDLAVDVAKRITTNVSGYTGIPEMIRSFAVDLGTSTLDAFKQEREKNKDGNDAYISTSESQQNDDTTTVHFGTLNKDGWTTLKFYSDIHKHEVEQQKNIICIDMGANMLPVKLGEKIKVEGLDQSYIVIQVKILSNDIWSRNYGHYGQPAQQTDIYNGGQSQIIYAIPTYSEDNVEKAVPPVISAPLVRKSGPQTAFVVDNGDPKMQGRVRIAYPWQSVNDSKRMALYKAEEELKRAQEFVPRAQQELERLQEELKKLMAEKENLATLALTTGEEKDQMVKSLEDQIKLIDKQIGLIDPDKSGKSSNVNDPSAPSTDGEKVYSEGEYKKLIDDQTKKKELETEKGQLQAKLVLLKSSISEGVDKIKDKKEKAIAKLQDELDKSGKTKEDALKKLDAAKKEVKEKAEKWSGELKSIATPWIRQATPMATDGGGAFFKPNEGDEVIVNYDNDNIERPYVVGSVYSKNLNEPNSFHKGAITMQSPNGQFISLTSAKGGKFLESIAPIMKPISAYIPPIKKGLKSIDSTVAGGIVMSDRYGMFKIDMSSHGRKIDIESPFGKVGISAFTGITINAPNGDIKICGKNVSIEAGNNLTLKSGTNVDYDDFSLSKMIKDMLKDTGKNVIDAAADFLELSPLVSMKLVDFALLRCVIDTFLKPVEGTLCIKSKNYLILEAGKGKAQIPLERHSKKWQEFKKMEKDGNKQIFYAKTAEYVKRIENKLNQFSNDYLEMKKEAYKQKQAYEKALSIFWDPSKAKPEVVKDAFKLGDGDFKENDKTTFTGGTVSMAKFEQANYLAKPTNGYKTKDGGLLTTLPMVKAYIMPKAESYAKAVYQLQKKAHQFLTVFSDETLKVINQSTIGTTSDKDTKWMDDIFKSVVFHSENGLLKKTMDKWEAKYGSKGGDPKADFMGDGDLKAKTDPFINTLLLKREMVALILANMYKAEANAIDPSLPQNARIYGKIFSINYKDTDVNEDFLQNKWDDVLALGGKKKSGIVEGLKKGASMYAEFMGIDKAWKPIINPDAPMLGWAQKVWNEDTPGQIIFSNSKNATYNLSGENIEKYDFNSMTNEETLKKALAEIGKA